MIGIGRWHAHGPVQIRQRIIRGVSLGFLNAPLHLAHGVKILADPRAITRPELSLETRDVFIEPIEEAGPFPQRSLSVRNAAAFAEQALENNSRMRFRRQRRRRRRPREIILVNTGVAIVALADHLHQVHRELQRRQLRLLTDVLRGDLIDRGSQVVVRAFRQFRLGSAQEGGVGGRMAAGVGVLQFQVRDGGDMFLNRSQ